MIAQRSDTLLAVLQDAGFEFIVVGGVAAIAHGSTRSTKDLDVVAPFTPSNLQRLLDALTPHHLSHYMRPDLGPAWQTAEELASHRIMLLSSDLGRLDVLRDVPPVGTFQDVETVELELVPGRLFRVISLDQLIEIKSMLSRPQDKDVEKDLRVIRQLKAQGGSTRG